MPPVSTTLVESALVLYFDERGCLGYERGGFSHGSGELDETPRIPEGVGDKPAGPTAPRRRQRRLTIIRVGLPGATATAGVILVLVGPATVGVILIGAAAVGAITDIFARLTIESGDDRDREQRARDEFGRTGRWPRGR
jgi:hypothetical protein